jgi:hypothetical protein
VVVKVRGLKEIEAQLVELGSKTGTRIMRASMLEASKPILSRAESNAASLKTGSGALRESLGMRFSAGRSGSSELPNMGGRFTVQIAPFRKDRTAIALYNLIYKRKRPVRGIRHGHLVELGHRLVRNGREVGSVPARPFLAPALQSGSTDAVAILARELQERIARQLKKNRRK